MCVFTWKTKKWQTCYFNNFVKTQIEIWAKHIFIATSSFFLLFAWLGIPCASARKTVCALWQNMGCFYFATYTWNISQECRVLDSCAIYQAQYWFETRKQEGSFLIKSKAILDDLRLCLRKLSKQKTMHSILICRSQYGMRLKTKYVNDD